MLQAAWKQNNTKHWNASHFKLSIWKYENLYRNPFFDKPFHWHDMTMWLSKLIHNSSSSGHGFKSKLSSQLFLLLETSFYWAEHSLTSLLGVCLLPHRASDEYSQMFSCAYVVVPCYFGADITQNYRVS